MKYIHDEFAAGWITNLKRLWLSNNKVPEDKYGKMFEDIQNQLMVS